MTAIYYDCEFLEDGRTIDLISIGMVTEDGRELYLINGSSRTIGRALESPWLRENVFPSLPVHVTGTTFRGWDHDHPDWLAVNRRDTIADSVRDFVLAEPDPHLWAWYAAYDHVALCQLWGRMVDLPKGVPMWTNDLKQEAERLGNPALPSLPAITEHNALDDAREVKFRAEWLAQHHGGAS
jgi:3' exoribonuclease, RNase T-like